ncbi:hypothetical protein CANCADRAFT_85893 [Tortispora caseinolytica NRRL Y-17796]|uniref:Uncharacterized protein n=1 Tax=Tortispora caseinolytica NRRL Y-17796 TaxID=767744 RepID=A0A1E4TKT6_9ASCO|nr:hypothetical protein CANCADRAFT_85893 [Tortispora caseinolytica NRRL Y-17796]
MVQTRRSARLEEKEKSVDHEEDEITEKLMPHDLERDDRSNSDDEEAPEEVSFSGTKKSAKEKQKAEELARRRAIDAEKEKNRTRTLKLQQQAKEKAERTSHQKLDTEDMDDGNDELPEDILDAVEFETSVIEGIVCKDGAESLDKTTKDKKHKRFDDNDPEIKKGPIKLKVLKKLKAMPPPAASKVVDFRTQLLNRKTIDRR